MDDLVTGLMVGFVAAVALMGLVGLLWNRRLKDAHTEEVRRYDASIVDLRQERAEDKETNRRLRHELISQSPDRLMETANAAELERATAVSERDQAIEQLQLVERDLTLANGRLADREAKLRQYREALKEIRMSLEAQDRGHTARAADGLIDTDTGDLPAGSVSRTGSSPYGTPPPSLDAKDVESAAMDPAAVEASALEKAGDSIGGAATTEPEAEATAVDSSRH